MAKTSGNTQNSGTRDPKVSKELMDMNEALRKLEMKNQELERKLLDAQKKAVEYKQTGGLDESAVINELKAQIDLLSRQVMQQQSAYDPYKPKYRAVPPDDWQEETVSFSARKVFFIVGSYIDSKGVERIPPYKLIKFRYAASDIKKDGREDQVLNYCVYQTNLKAEIEFLRNHPAFGIEFHENLNTTMNDDLTMHEFRIKAATSINSMSDDAIINMAHQKKVPNVNKKTVRELRVILTQIISNELKESADALEKEQLKRRALGGRVELQEST